MRAYWRSPYLRYGSYIAGVVLLVTALFPSLIRNLFNTGSFMPHATCYLQDPGIIWLHVTTDLLIGLAYVSISTTLGYLVYKASRHIPFHWVFLAFGVFIISCGFTHFMEVLTVWRPLYWLSGYVKVVTAAASVVTAAALFPLVPKVFRLIDEVKAAEERRLQLEKAHRQLERAHEELAAQKAELELANRDLEMFAHSVAHDLKAPARAVTGFCNILESDYGAKLNAEAHDLIGRIVKASRTMQELLRDLLQYASVSRTDVQLEQVSLEASINDALTMIEADRVARNAIIRVEPSALEVLISRSLMLQVLVNLVGNALKYVAEGVRPEVQIRAEPRAEMVRIWIEDNGIGIEPGHQEKIFGMFVRLHGRDAYDGTGVGLAIVRRAVERMEGRVGLESHPGRGSRFWFEVRSATVTSPSAKGVR